MLATIKDCPSLEKESEREIITPYVPARAAFSIDHLSNISSF